MSYNRRGKQHGSYHQQGKQQKQESESPIKYVHIDGLVILKIIKHCHEENISADVQGVLLGLVSQDGMGSKLEITNCFPLPLSNDDDDSEAVLEYQYAMLRHLKNANVDHLQVGWYQCNPYGSQVNKIETIDSQFVYQSQIDESVVLFFDPIRTQRGFLALKAYRLTNSAMALCKENEFKADTLRQMKMSYDKFFEEIPIIIRNSHLIKALLIEVEDEMPRDAGKQILDIGGTNIIERSIQSQTKAIEDLNKQTYQLRVQTIKHHEIAKENMIRSINKLPPLNDEEMAKILKQFKNSPIQRLENILNYAQTANYFQQSALFTSQNINKLFMAKAIQKGASREAPEGTQSKAVGSSSN